MSASHPISEEDVPTPAFLVTGARPDLRWRLLVDGVETAASTRALHDWGAVVRDLERASESLGMDEAMLVDARRPPWLAVRRRPRV